MKIALSVLMSASLNAAAVTITFDDIADGTPLSAGNPYAGIAVLNGHSREFVYFDPSEPDVIEREFTIHNGKAREPDFITHVSPGDFERFWQTDMTIDFLEPVAELSFVAEAFRHAAFFFTATDGVTTHDGFFQFGGDLDHEYHTYTVDVPDGFRITGASMANRDEMMPGLADFSVDSISFELTPQPGRGLVPDGGPSVLLMAAAMLLVLGARRLAL